MLSNDIITRANDGGLTLWVSQRLVCERCGMSDGYLRKKARYGYAASLRASWRVDATRMGDFFLGKSGAAWRWGRKGGIYYYDYDTIPPATREMLGGVSELLSELDGFDRSRKYTPLELQVLKGVSQCMNPDDVHAAMEYRVCGRAVLTPERAERVAEAAAWCRYLRMASSGTNYRDCGFASLAALRETCVRLISEQQLESLHIRKPDALRKKIEAMPSDAELIGWLVGGRYGNINPLKVGRCSIVDKETGEIYGLDAHEALMFTYWLNPGRSEKNTKVSSYADYLQDCKALDILPIAQSTFTHHLNRWSVKLLSAKERHGDKVADELYRPYVPAKPLEYANSLWAADGSGIVPYRYMDERGKWRSMKIYVMLVSDVASRCIVGWAVSRSSQHMETPQMMKSAMRMALRRNGRAQVMDFISDNHGAFTSDESRKYLASACRNFRNIVAGNSKANPAESMFRMFKRRFKSYFNLPETSWSAAGADSKANPDYFDIMALPTYEEAIDKLNTAVSEWNATPMSNGMTPDVWFDTLKNPAAGVYEERPYRLITGYKAKKDLSYARGVMTLEHGAYKGVFEVPADADSVALVAKYLGYASSFDALVYWDESAADVYTANGKYIYTCRPARLAAKSASEATRDSWGALSHNYRRCVDFDADVDGWVDNVASARETLIGGYDYNTRALGTKEDFNGMREQVSSEEMARASAARQSKELRRQKADEQKEAVRIQEAALAFKRRHCNTDSYIK